MSYTQVTLKEVVKKQYSLKLKAFTDLLNPLIFMQLIALFFSLNGIGQRGVGGNLSITYYSTDFVVFFTILWAFIIAIQLRMKNYRQQMLPFVYNSTTTALSDGLFLLTASIIGAVFSLASRYILLAITRFVLQHDQLLGTNIIASPLELLMGVIATIVVIFTFGLIGYFVGTLIQWNKGFAYILLTVLIGGLLSVLLSGNETLLNILQMLFKFYFFEKNFFLFLVKFLGTASLGFFIALKLSHRLEVS